IASLSRWAGVIFGDPSGPGTHTSGSSLPQGATERCGSTVFMSHLLLIPRRWQTLASDDLTECLKSPATCLLAQRHPQIFQRDALVPQKGGAPLSFLRMGHLLGASNGIAEPTRRVAEGRRLISAGGRTNVDPQHDHGYCIYVVCNP